VQGHHLLLPPSGEVIVNDVDRLQEINDELLAACHAVVPWVAIALIGQSHPHEKAVENHRNAFNGLVDALAKAEGKQRYNKMEAKS
jgi:hypothetical protein